MSLIMEVLSRVEKEQKPAKIDFEQSSNTIVLDPEPKRMDLPETGDQKEEVFIGKQIYKEMPKQPVILQQQTAAGHKHHLGMFIALGLVMAGMLAWYVIMGRGAAVKITRVVPVDSFKQSNVSLPAAAESVKQSEPVQRIDERESEDPASYFLKSSSQKLTLEGLVLDGKDPYCLIRGKILKVGDWLDDKKVVAITSEGVTLNVSTGGIIFLANKN